MVLLKSLIQKYSDNCVLQFEDWFVKRGDSWLLLGGSGSGKTTLLHIITGLLKPRQGSVEINDTELYQLSSRELDLFRGRNIGIVFQRPHLIKGLTILENIQLAQSFAGHGVDKIRVRQALDSLGIIDQENKYPHQLSQGQLQRASIARAVVNKPGLIVADEPTSSLDDKNASVVLDILLNQAALTAATLIVATHDQRIKYAFPTSNTHVLT